MGAMRAYVLDSFDTPPALAEVPTPVPGPGEVRVRVAASSVNPVDAAIGAGFFRTLSQHRLPAILGRDLAGTIDQVGEGVTSFKPGDEVLGMVKRDYVGDGTFAEYVVVPADRFLVARPPELKVTEAGALGLVGVTALLCLDAIACEPGEVIFVNGATGGVGAILLQAARTAGLRVIATARPGVEEDHVKALGAWASVDWSQGNVGAQVREIAPTGVAGVVDLVSRTPDAFAAMASLAASDRIAATTLGAGRTDLVPGVKVANVHSDGTPKLLNRVVDLVKSGAVHVPMVKVFPFDHIEAAFSELSGAPRGKVGLSIGSEGLT